MIRERVIAGLKRARARGKKLGRPTISPAKERAIRAGLGFRKIMAKHKVGTSVIQRIKAEIAAECGHSCCGLGPPTNSPPASISSA